MIAIRVDRTGDASVLQPEEVPSPEPATGSLVVEVAAAGLNFIDTYQRSGLYPMPLPAVLGQEGAGRVVAVGEEVHRALVEEREG